MKYNIGDILIYDPVYVLYSDFWENARGTQVEVLAITELGKYLVRFLEIDARPALSGVKPHKLIFPDESFSKRLKRKEPDWRV